MPTASTADLDLAAVDLHDVRLYVDVCAISRDTATVSSHRAGIHAHPDQVVPLDLTRNLLLYMDPPQHTTYRLILQKATGLLALLEHPGQLQELVEQPDLIPGAVEEILRWTSVVRWFSRTATKDTEVGGQPIAEGDRVVTWCASASFDEAVFAPEHFDIHRSKPEHKAFGGGGRHFCLGAGLARAELRIALEEITRRLRELRRAGDVARLPSSWANGLTAFPVTFAAGERERA